MALDGFYLEDKHTIVGRVDGKVMRLTQHADHATYSDGVVKVQVALAPSGPALLSAEVAGAPAGHEVRGDRIVVLAALLAGVKSTVNPVSAALV